MPVEGLDHLAITVADMEATVDWYHRVLGAEPLLLDLWRDGKVPVVLLQVGVSRLSVHSAAAPAAPHAQAPTVGANDICFRYAGPVSEVLSLLEAQGIEVVEGPVPRPASNGERGQSVYFRDPDENLIELLTLTT
ncbi:MAG TPA: VOC family protein [Frankiaceae bacterium]|jgi:catechol 2,3-dioxygenase-like lactoylglutathione lyase family enzyme|nr:VOC family protein [Frankiaceae bacterium]